jgi:hypothetical protein
LRRPRRSVESADGAFDIVHGIYYLWFRLVAMSRGSCDRFQPDRTFTAMTAFQKTHSQRSRRALAAMLAPWLIVFLSACTTVKDTAKGTARVVTDTSRKVTGMFTPGGSDLVHKVALIGVENQPSPGTAGFPVLFQKFLTGFLQNDCRRSVVDSAAGEILKSPPRLASGQIDGYALALMGRPRGLNFFVIGTLTDIRLLDEKTGFWLWKDTRYKIRAALRIEMIDSATGTKALDEIFAEEAVIEELRHQQLQQSGPLPLSEIEPILNRLLPEAGYKLCTTLANQPWQGFVVAAEEDRITISSGSAVGLAAGRVVEVFGSGRIVQSKDGQRFLQPGDRVGEARVASVSAETADALVSPPSRVGPGGTVRLK